MKSRTFAIIFFSVFSLWLNMVQAQDVVDEIEYSTNANRDAQYLLVSLNGVGSVSFTQPEVVVVKSELGSTTASLRIGSSCVPGVGPIVKFRTSRDAELNMSDKQIINIEADKEYFILLANNNYPAMSFTFQ